MTQEELQEMTGANNYNRPQLLKLKSMRLNGDTGKFVITHLDQQKGEDGRYKSEEIEGPIKVVFLKIRRKLVETDRDGIKASTNEHNTPNDIVNLWQKDKQGTEHGIARELRDRHENLRTEQIVYVRYKGEIYRLSVKGASLSGTEDTTNFYKYLSSFTDYDFDWWNTQTRLVPTAGGDGKRSYYFIDFQVADKLDETQQAQVFENIKYVHDNCVKVDAFYQTASIDAEQQKETKDVTPTDYPDEEINPEDIPF